MSQKMPRDSVARRACGRLARGVAVACLLSCSAPRAALAQRAVELQVGSWAVSGSNVTLYAVGLWRHVTGPLGVGLRGHAAVAEGSGDASLYGLGPEITLLRGSQGISPYVVAGVSLGVRSADSTDVAALWSAGAGIEMSPASWLGLALEVGYYAEDVGVHGFWDLRDGDRRGPLVSARVSARWGGGGGGGSRTVGGTRGTGSAPAAGAYDPSPSSEAAVPLSPAAATLAYDIVEAAVAAMGEPYRWGGTTTEGGFDCSGLVWYAYTTHGVNLPRVSREQARAGRAVAADVAALAPGDILLFAERGSAVTHVGLFIGNGRFIHATESGGVQASELSPNDTYGRWWFARWVGARRVLR
jgi:cell wall-associated NlpC family hydrolase